MALLLCTWWLGNRFSASIVAKNERGFLVLEADDVA